MRPDTPISPLVPSKDPQPAHTPPVHTPLESQQKEAAATIIRSQIDVTLDQAARKDQETNPYHRTHQQSTQPTAEQWQQYHSAWQDYYQKYYERYYVGQVHQARQAIATQNQAPQQVIGGPATVDIDPSGTTDKEEALYDLRHQLLDSVQQKARKVRGSRHFVPITAAVVVMLIFTFLQYNQVLMANVQAYVSPGTINPENIIVDPSTSTTVDPASTTLVIPKINVEAPVDYNAKPDYDSQMASMKNGLAYFGIAGASSKPGQVGNTPIAGHSSNDVLEAGGYKFIFAQLEKIQTGDAIYANYQGTRYTYVVTKKEVVLPTEVSKLVYTTDKPMLTLITCTPLGTAQKRLLVTAEQVNPSPAGAAQPTEAPTASSTATTEMAGTSPTIFERLFGAR
jgi:sortase A